MQNYIFFKENHHLFHLIQTFSDSVRTISDLQVIFLLAYQKLVAILDLPNLRISQTHRYCHFSFFMKISHFSLKSL